ncbi:lipid II:glycine glycyltransferase FemX [Anaerobium acetethylicum]|uniref:Acetyltransferase (GNAT) domain-containing protein n=1 Tax=Anaerobium acetethylicum TaxID=1619234 RepID=A0A1D3TTW4_9FIRM|nr:GNAT family N-acetyltransferase [Anaerobium acetethylicum]SCP97478.1 Acetyltransferase (GNAT) domain-containing protein [Anaerobium acetethylicum]
MISEIMIDESDKWDKIVNTFEKYDVYYLSGYAKSLQFHGDGEPILFYYEGDGIRAINVVMKRDISKAPHFSGKLEEGAYFDIATPYGYGGFLIEGEVGEDSLKRFDEEYSFYCKDRGIVSEFVRFHPVLNNSAGLEEIYQVREAGKTVSIHLDSQEQITEALSGNTRREIKKSTESGVEVFWGRSPWLYQEFITLYTATMDRRNAKSYYYFEKEFFDALLNDLKYNAMLFYSVYEGRIIAMALVLMANQKMHYHLAAGNIDYQKFSPMALMIYEAACWGCENGFDTFHMGGGLGGSEDSLFRFKKGFNRNEANVFSLGSKIFDEAKYAQLAAMRKTEDGIDNTGDFFPVYRAVPGTA